MKKERIIYRSITVNSVVEHVYYPQIRNDDDEWIYAKHLERGRWKNVGYLDWNEAFRFLEHMKEV